ncbi:30S ribosomal protein S5 [Candidatus Peregrinibacteria bacterium]|nr:30S ribosomal protein S5 [Candidatus Peregrinibacteria bacterium]
MKKGGRAPIKEQKEFEEEVIQIDRVTRVVKGGRRLRFRATVVIGNKKGKVGVGIGKSVEVTGAISKAIAQAKKDMINVPMAGTTIPHQIKHKFKSSNILLLPACPGTGIKAGGSIRKVLELAGIKDIMSKSYGTTNKLNNSQGTISALSTLKTIPWLKIQPNLSDEEEKKKVEAKKAPNQKKKFTNKKPSSKAKVSKNSKSEKNTDQKKETKKSEKTAKEKKSS